MLTMQRNGLTTSTPGLVDNLTMSYVGNQLSNVNDSIVNIALSTSMDFKEYTEGTGIEYTYNKNGAMMQDLNKGITDIQYNSLNLPQAILGDMHTTGNTGEIYSGDNDNVVMHETAHLMGLADRYEDLDGGNLGGGGSFVHPGYEKDLMSRGRVNTKLDESHYKHYIDMYGAASQNINTARGKIQVGRGRNKYGNINLMTPYEKGGFHKDHPFKKR